MFNGPFPLPKSPDIDSREDVSLRLGYSVTVRGIVVCVNSTNRIPLPFLLE